MNIDGRIFHVSRDPYMWQDEDGSVHVRLDASKGLIKSAEVIFGDKHGLDGGGDFKKTKMTPYISSSYLDTFVGVIKQEEKTVVYCFRITLKDDSKVLYTTLGAMSEPSAPLNRSLTDAMFQVCWKFPGERMALPRIGRTQGVVYQIFPDRFAVGEPKKSCMQDANLKVGEKPIPRSFFGGDLKGIEEKIPYLKSLGVGTVYLTPVWKSKSNHRYDVEDYLHVDDRLGGDSALLSLSKKVHAAGMKLVLDAVFNHTSYFHPFFQDVVSNGKSSPYYSWYLIQGNKPDLKRRNYDTFAGAGYMPKLNTENPEVIKYLCSTIRELTLKFSVDGWRFDVADEVAHAAWFDIRRTLKSINPDIVMVAEDWLASDNFVDSYQFDGAMNYVLRKIILDAVASDKPTPAKVVANRLVNLLLRYSWYSDLSMFNLVASHDVPRLYSMTNENSDKTLLGTAIAAVFPGMLMAYYGDELKMIGGPDPDNRRPVDWDSSHWDADYFDRYRALLHLKDYSCANLGRAEIRAESNLLFIVRYDESQTLTLIANISDRNGFYTASRNESAVASNGVDKRKIKPWGYLVTKVDKGRKY